MQIAPSPRSDGARGRCGSTFSACGARRPSSCTTTGARTPRPRSTWLDARGRVSLGPALDEGFNGLAVQGGGRTVRDSAALLDLGHAARSRATPTSREQPIPPLRGGSRRARSNSLRIGVPLQAWGGRRTAAPVAEALARTVRLLESLGHRTEEATVGLGADWEDFVLANARLSTANLAASVDDLAAALGRPADSSTLEPATLAAHRYGQRVSGPQFVAALTIRNRVARSLGQYFTTHDLLLTPTLPEPPPRLGAYGEGAQALDGLGWIDRLNDRSPFTMAFNVAGTPAMSVPLAADPGTGLPIGMQFAAGYGREDLLFRLAGQLEQAQPWSDRTPAVWAGDPPVPVTS
ncbi:Amidase OS=Streptomyces tendae OX=1932 GN=GUR47_23550 PE=3 SV=1 [Streptomyces tendae]